MEENFRKNAKFLLLTVGFIILMGLMMVYSSSYIYARDTMGSSWYLIGKQVFFLIAGMTSMAFMSQLPFRIFYKNAYYLQWASIVLLFLTFTSILGVNVKGSYRWISFMGATLQPGEIIKYSMILCSLKFFTEYKDYTKEQLTLGLLTLGTPLIVLLFQPDFGTFVICCMAAYFCAFMTSFSKKILAGIGIFGLTSIGLLLVAAPYRVKRLMVFLDPWSDPRGSGFQIIQSYVAFANGGLSGTGLGASLQKLFYLPEAYNDFILSVLGEELGFIGIFIIVILFIFMMLFGFRLAMNVAEEKGRVFIASVIFLIGFQAFLNMAVVLGLLPTKGLNLPFISYGGSSLLANLSALGVVLSFGNFNFLNLKKRLS